MEQKTIKKAFSVEGPGLHTGGMIHATLLPAEENTGIRIRRVDIEGQPTYEALAEYVHQTTRGTVLENGLWRVSTVEHMMAALYAMGVTNCLIEVDAPEIPILDGSARIYIEHIQRVGLQTQQADAKEWIVTEPFEYTNGKGSSIRISPCDHYEVAVHVKYPSAVLNEQSAEMKSITDFAEQIANARTFCFLREIKPLLNLGLIKGGDLDNAIVIYDKRIWQFNMNRLARKMGKPTIDASRLGYLTELRFDNEPARHKLLDIVGDLALLGMHIRGKIEAICPGHGVNTACCKQLRQIVNK